MKRNPLHKIIASTAAIALTMIVAAAPARADNSPVMMPSDQNMDVTKGQTGGVLPRYIPKESNPDDRPPEGWAAFIVSCVNASLISIVPSTPVTATQTFHSLYEAGFTTDQIQSLPSNTTNDEATLITNQVWAQIVALDPKATKYIDRTDANHVTITKYSLITAFLAGGQSGFLSYVATWRQNYGSAQ